MEMISILSLILLLGIYKVLGQEEEVIFENSTYALFTSGIILWTTAQSDCINWGGNLVTIDSKQVDSLLYYMTSSYTCWIGLNDRDNEAGNNGDAFVWVDGSTSTYRQWDTIYNDEPDGNTNTEYDCVSFRYADGAASGWDDRTCDAHVFCYFCQKSGDSRGCDLIYDGSCYRAFEVSDGINWLDAQSSCAVWGGDLTSITTERENNLLYTAISDTVSNCWIGLYERDGDGVYQWVDGTALSYTNWTGSAPTAGSTTDCVQMNSIGAGNWIAADCEGTSNSFICKKPSINTNIIDGRFGGLINERKNFQELSGNTFFFNSSLTLVCGGEENSNAIQWEYSQRSDLSLSRTLTPTYASTETGLSWITISNTQQGFYRCIVNSSLTYTIGLYDQSLTAVDVAWSTYTFLVGVDSEDVLLLCDPMDSSVILSLLKWVVQYGPTYLNPVTINNLKDYLSDQSTRISCTNGGTVISHIYIIMIVPEITIRYSTLFEEIFSSVYPSMNSITVPLQFSDVSLSININGKWNLPDNSNSTSSTIMISTFITSNAGVYKFYASNFVGEEVCVMQIELISSPTIIARNVNREVTIDETTYGYFSTTPDRVPWIIAQLNCIDWEGNLITIDSKRTDSLLYYMTSDYTCWIGLNDRDNEAGNNGSAFVWVDGSASTYRQWDTVYNNEPDGNTKPEYDCVSFRYLNGASNGWDDRNCNAHVSCYFCQKSGDSRGYDLIYDGSFYRAFEVSDGINWLDAQSSCAVWGGDLTSITTERENNLLYTAISDTVSNCWIGLFERDGDGVYQWVDGTALSYTNWAANEPNTPTTDNCVEMNSNGNWTNLDCDAERNWFICETNLSNISPVNIFGELTDESLNFRQLPGNIFFYNSTILAYKGDVNSAPIAWQYSVNVDLSSSEVLTATYMSIQTGVSWLSVVNTKQGYYQCYIDSTHRYTVGVYDTQKTTVASEGILYQYIVGIDREDVLLLCDPMDSMYDLNSLSWRVNGDTFSNPFNISSARNSLPVFGTEIICLSNSATILTSNIRIYVPEITVTYSSSDIMSFSILYPEMNSIQLEIESEGFSLSVSTTGRWKLQNGTYVPSSTVSYPILIYEYFGLYQFYVINWNGDEVCVIQITIIPEGYSTTNSISLSNSETIQNGSTIIIIDDSMINCIISNPDYSVEWFYRSQLGAVQTDVTSSSTFSAGTGISTLNVYSNQPGYYSCVINTDIVYSFFVADRDSLIEVMNFDSPSQQVDYTVGSTSSLLYYSVANIPDTSLRWTTKTVTNGADAQYSIEYTNPVLLSTVFSDVGAGVQTFSCFYRMSPVTLVGSLQLAIRDAAAVSISYDGYDNTFSDVNNIMFPSPQQITIPEGTRDVMLTCNLTQCIWMIQLKNRNYTVTMSPYIIPIFSEESEGSYSLMKETNTGQQYTTAHVDIYVQLNPTSQPASSPLVLIVIVALIIITIVVALIVIIPIICIIVVRKMKKSSTDTNRFLHKPTNTSKSNEMSREGTSGYVNVAEIQSPTKEYIDLSVNANVAEYITIDETSLIPLENEHNTKGRYYSNLANIPSNDNYEKVEGNREYIEVNQSESHEKNTPMSAIKETKKFVAKYVPTKDFPATYQQYVKSGMGNESLLSVEFQALNEESKKYVELSDEARKEQNMRKNPLKNIVPYDENRVVLDSPHLDCNYINASYISEYQFIASIHPTGDTLQDFLQMIFQTEASMVIMLTTRKKKAKIIGGSSNRVCYWPKKDEVLNCEPFLTSLISSTEMTAFVKQEISLKNTLEGKYHSFTHCISPIWNDDGAVVELSSAVTLLIRVIKQKRDYPLNPIIVHCEDGISKTGVFLTLFNVIKEMNLRKSISIFNTVKNMRRQRMNMVPTKACYATCYSMMNEYCSIHL